MTTKRRMSSTRPSAAAAMACCLLLTASRRHNAVHSFHQPAPSSSRATMAIRSASSRRLACAATPRSSSGGDSATGKDGGGSFPSRADDATTAASSTAWIQRDLESEMDQRCRAETSEASTSTSPDADADAPPFASGGPVRGPKSALIYDTTLRDGTQMESISVSCDDKLKIARRLSEFDVDYIEAGWPGSNPKDEEFFRRAVIDGELDGVARSKLVAFGSTRRKGVRARDDPQVRSLVESGAPTVCIVAKAHRWQVTDIIRANPDENLDMIRDSVEHLAGDAGRKVMVDLEHFFDGYKFDPEYTLECCRAAVEGGAEVLVMCDTNGGTMPWELEKITRETIAAVPSATFGIHCHNDCGLAVANSLTAVQAGVGLVQGTINGIGERTGNADLCSIIPSLALHCGCDRMACGGNLEGMTSLSRYMDEILNRTPDGAAPYVGASAFAHKGGLHVAALERSPDSYQHVDPGRVGNELRVLISELSGRQNILGKMKKLDLDMSEREDGYVNERALVILDRVKKLESMGYTFEGADASVELMILHSTESYCPPFQVLDYTAQVYDTNVDSASRVMSKMERDGSEDTYLSTDPSTLSRATVNVRLDDPNHDDFITRLEVAEGNGPVDALANALKKALAPTHPELFDLKLVDYKVRILDPESATQAATRVMIEFKNVESGVKWTTVSVDRNIISASLNALVDGFEYALKDVLASCELLDFE